MISIELHVAKMENSVGEAIIETPQTKINVTKRPIPNTGSPETPLSKNSLVTYNKGNRRK